VVLLWEEGFGARGRLFVGEGGRAALRAAGGVELSASSLLFHRRSLFSLSLALVPLTPSRVRLIFLENDSLDQSVLAQLRVYAALHRCK
jgi:hypothetical protein